MKFLIRDELGEFSRNLRLNPNGRPTGSSRQHIDIGRFLRFPAGAESSTGEDPNSPGLWISSVSGWIDVRCNKKSRPHTCFREMLDSRVRPVHSYASDIGQRLPARLGFVERSVRSTVCWVDCSSCGESAGCRFHSQSGTSPSHGERSQGVFRCSH